MVASVLQAMRYWPSAKRDLASAAPNFSCPLLHNPLLSQFEFQKDFIQ